MRPEEKLHRAVWDALDEITQQKLATPEDEWVLVGCRTPERKRAIEALKHCGAIKIVRPRNPSPPFGIVRFYEIQGADVEPIGYYVDVVEPRFTETLDTYYEAIGKHGTRTLETGAIAQLTAKLKEWRNEHPAVLPSAKPSTSPSNGTEKPKDKKIEKLTFILPEKGTPNKLTVIVNDDYKKPCHFDTNKPSGALLLKIAQENRETIPYSENKEPFDYLNSDKNQLITTTGCVRTKILQSEAGYVEPTVAIERIKEKAFKQRQGKPPKNA